MASKIAAAATVRAVKFKRPIPTRAALVLVSVNTNLGFFFKSSRDEIVSCYIIFH